jgi:23S rRNA maturation mini-RNase III
MNVKPNFRRGKQYYYIHRATLACAFLGGAVLLGEKKAIPCYLKSPQPRSKFHRVEIVIVRTKAEAKALNRKYAKLRARRLAEGLHA